METANQFPQRGHLNGSAAGESGESGQISQIFDRIMNIIITTSNQNQMVSMCIFNVLFITLKYHFNFDCKSTCFLHQKKSGPIGDQIRQVLICMRSHR